MNPKDARILYFGTPSMSAEVLSCLISNGYNVVGLVCQPDKEVGRKAKKDPVPTKEVALKHKIPVYQPVKLRDDYSFVSECHPDVIVTFAFGQIIPQAVLDIPTIGCINIHGSLLPKYRGASPVQAAIIHRDTKSGVSLMEMSAKMDQGCVYATKECDITPSDNSETLFAKITKLAKEVILENLDSYIEGNLKGVPQNEEEATYCYTIKAEEERLDINKPIEELLGWILALSPTPGGYFILRGQKLKVFDAEIVNDKVTHPLGCICRADQRGLYLQCKDGVLSLLSLQLEGKKRMDYRSFINGQPRLEEVYLS